MRPSLFALAPKPADRSALRKGADIPQHLRCGVTKCLNLYVPKFKNADEVNLFCEAAEDHIALSDITTLPGME